MFGGAEAVAIIDGIPGTELVPITLFMIFVPYAVWGWVKSKRIEEKEKTRRLEKATIRGEAPITEKDLNYNDDGESKELDLPKQADVSPQQRIGHAIENGWKLKDETRERTILENRDYGTRKRHLLILLLTFWTYGIGNLVYGVYCMKKKSDTVVVNKMTESP